MDRTSAPAKTNTQAWNIVGYLAFTLAGLYFAFLSTDPDNGFLFLTLAVAFDPFIDREWNARPKWQRAVLLVHIAITAIAAYMIYLH